MTYRQTELSHPTAHCFLVGGIIRVGGRLNKAPIRFETNKSSTTFSCSLFVETVSSRHPRKTLPRRKGTHTVHTGSRAPALLDLAGKVID